MSLARSSSVRVTEYHIVILNIIIKRVINECMRDRRDSLRRLWELRLVATTLVVFARRVGHGDLREVR
jgi:hypothetical protein